MKKEGHPPYQDVLFVDSSTGFKFVCGSTLQPKERETFEGKEYPVYRMPISSASHPFFTGSKQFIDSEGRVDKFVKRYAKKPEKKEEAVVEADKKKVVRKKKTT
ncbi:MAG: type B 50S ribosomal protein L31 [Rhabdochlamydiaceae bacterium]|nr:type B 50S ribosomal protein L31 [Rhabdochlamydiaceae bacterium]